jgi:hypothetical protein
MESGYPLFALSSFRGRLILLVVFAMGRRVRAYL